MSAAIWYTPIGATTMKRLDLGPLQAMPVEQPREAQAQETGGGRIVQLNLRARQRVRPVRGPSTDDELRCRLVAVENHLQLGGTIILAGHAEFAWAGFASVLPLAGGRLIPIEGDIYRELGGGLIGAGDHIILQSDSPKQVLERHRVFSQTTRDFVTTEWGVDHDWQEIGTYCLLRHWSFFPALRLAKEAIGRPILTTNRENTWTFDAVLDEDIDKLRALSQAGGVPVQGTTDTGLETQDSVVESQLESAYDTALGSVGAL